MLVVGSGRGGTDQRNRIADRPQEYRLETDTEIQTLVCQAMHRIVTGRQGN